MKGSLHELLNAARSQETLALLANADPAPVLAALGTRRKNLRELALLLSPGADAVRTALFENAQAITLERFGRARLLYAPLYLSSRCAGTCPYCGFRGDRQSSRLHLSLDDALAEGHALTDVGIQHVLLVSGDDPTHVDVGFVARVATHLRALVTSVAVEIPAASEDDYRVLGEAGVDGVTLYQETYDPAVYAAVHNFGPKADYAYRLNALDRAGRAGIRRLNVGALLGLAPWRQEALRLSVHIAHLTRTYWQSAIGVGIPRLRFVPDGFTIPHPVADAELCHLVAVLRLCFEDLGIVVSTREQPALRERLLGIGATQASAGSKTAPGGYSLPGRSEDQFQVADTRSPAEFKAALLAAGYDPVVKDWDHALDT